MRKLIYIFVFVFFIKPVISQQLPQYSHYILNHFAINPAVAGSKTCLDATFGYRNQWVGFEGAPRTSFGSVHAVLKKNKYGLENKHAMGVIIVNDRFGPFSRAKFKAAYAYHFPFNRKVLMSVGMFVGIEQLSFRSGEVTLINFNDNAIGQASNALIIPEVVPGIFLQNDKWFGGLSIHQTTNSQIKAVGTAESKLARHAFVSFGRKFEHKNWKIIPSTLIKTAPAAPPTVDLNLMFNYKSAFSFGATYRNIDAVAALIKFRALDYFNIGYAFDYTLSKIQAGAANTHEIVISINPCGNRPESKYGCPTFY